MEKLSIDEMMFFEGHPNALGVYEAFVKKLFQIYPDTTLRVQKTQITYSNRHVFACVSFAKVRKAKERPPVYIVVTFGLAYKKESPRIDIATEPYPNRWTHHVLVSEEEQIDEELLGWVEEAAAFSAAK